MTGLYTYGVIEQEDLELTLEGVAGSERVFTIDQRPFSAVVSEIDDVEEPPQSEENLRAHSDVLQAVLEHDGGRTVVPMQYGMVFAGAPQVKNVLRGSRAAFTRALREIDGAVELGVKAVEAEDADVDRADVEAEASEHFDELARSVTENEDFSDRLLLNRAYLVDRSDRPAFDDAVGAFESAFEDEVTVQYTGPWAPYNFVEINIGAKA